MDILSMDSNESWYPVVEFAQNKVFTQLSFSCRQRQWEEVINISWVPVVPQEL